VKIPGRVAALFPVTGLVASYVGQVVERSWEGWGVFLLSWFASTIAVVLFTMACGVVIMATHKFFLEEKYTNNQQNSDKMFFYVLITALVVAVLLAVILPAWVNRIRLYPPPDAIMR
jgi:hypothetical protein